MLSERPYMRQTTYRPGPSMTAILVGTNVGVYVIQSLLEASESSLAIWFFSNLPLKPDQLWHGAVWQLITFQFLHGGLLHLLVNCLMLYVLGRHVETMLGSRAFTGFYLTAGAAGGILQSVLMLLFPSHFGTERVVGASAGVAGLLGLFAVLNRDTYVHVLLAFIIPIRIRAIALLYILIAIALLGMLQPHSNIAHAAHLGGMLAGIAYAKYLQSPYHWRYRVPRITILRRVLPTAGRHGRSWSDFSDEEDDLPPDEFIEKEVDPILDKILRHGIESLTERERRILEKARKKVRHH